MAKFINGVTDYEEYRKNCKENDVYLSKMAIVNAILAKKERGEEITLIDQIMLVRCINVSTLTGKLEGFYAISTSVLMNPVCQERAKDPNSICSKCYAAKGAAFRTALALSLEVNHLILNNFLICEDAWRTLVIPTTNGKSRIESHGDTASSTCAINYLRIIRTHDFLTFGVWTKNTNHYRIAFNKEGKPKNMIFILSSDKKNVVADVPADMVEYVDHVFTVYELEYAKEHGIKINCGVYDENYKQIDHHCKTCLRCYTFGTEFYINELIK